MYVVDLESLLVQVILIHVLYVVFHLNLYDIIMLRQFEHQWSLMGLMKPMDLGKSFQCHFHEFYYIKFHLDSLSSHHYK